MLTKMCKSPHAVADLHLHSVFSDGTYTPESLVRRALEVGLSFIALTDHDTVEGCSHTRELCAQAGIGFIPGVELTTYALEEEVHILGLGIDTQNEMLLQHLEKFQVVRRERTEQMIALLNRNGVAISMEDIQTSTKCRAVGRMHIAKAIVNKGICRDRDEVFSKYIGDGCIAWVPKKNCKVHEAVSLIHQAGGVAIMAHPGIQDKEPALTSYAIDQGIDGFECFHPRHYKSTTQRLLKLCEEKGLLITGGSDCHGVKERIHLGSIHLPIQYVERLKDGGISKI